MFVKFVKDDKTIEEVSISSEMIPFPTDIVVLVAGKFTVESREYDLYSYIRPTNYLDRTSSRV